MFAWSSNYEHQQLFELLHLFNDRTMIASGNMKILPVVRKKGAHFFKKGWGVFDFDYLSQALLQLIFLSSSWLWFNIYSMVRSGVCYMWITGTTQDRGAVMTYCFLQTLYFELIQVFIICHPWFVCVSLQISSEKIFIYILFELEVRFLIVNMTH